jgi:hypothetical protein
MATQYTYKPTPAYISYTPESGGELRELKFHSVISEAHGASAQVTKFPVQTGFVISNNTIRQNRKITIQGIITNTVLDGAKNDYTYGSNNSKTMFAELESVVNLGEVCHVVTNLGTYDKVIFTTFNTKQAQGMTDAMEFTITGEEVQISTTVAGTAPKIMTFKALSGAQEINRISALRAAGIDVCDDATVSECVMDMGQDYIIKDFDTAGNPVSTTLVSAGQDAVTGSWLYDMHTSATELYRTGVTGVQTVVGSTQDMLSKATSGFNPVGDCLVGATAGVAEDVVTDVLNTEMGELKKSLYGALYSTMGLTDDEYGQTLIHAGVGCLVRGVTNNPETRFPYSPGEGLPTVPNIVEGIFRQSEAIALPDTNQVINGVVAQPTTITKIDC